MTVISKIAVPNSADLTPAMVLNKKKEMRGRGSENIPDCLVLTLMEQKEE